MKHPSTPAVLGALANERERQVAKGWTREHDDEHRTHDLIDLARERMDRKPTPASGLSRQRLIEGIAMLVAAVEAMDRRGDA